MTDWPSFTVAELQEEGTLLVEDGNHGEYRPRPSVTALLAAGVPVKVVSQRIGHASPMVTMTIYQHVLPGDDRAAAGVGARAILGES